MGQAEHDLTGVLKNLVPWTRVMQISIDIEDAERYGKR